jgi:hypothetical protein
MLLRSAAGPTFEFKVRRFSLDPLPSETYVLANTCHCQLALGLLQFTDVRALSRKYFTLLHPT